MNDNEFTIVVRPEDPTSSFGAYTNNMTRSVVTPGSKSEYFREK